MMTISLRHISAAFAVALTMSGAAAAQDGAALYKENCASCHDRGIDRAPALEALRTMTPQRVLESMESGPMVSMAHGRTAVERRAIAEFASGRSFDSPLDTRPSPQAMCRPAGDANAFEERLRGPIWNGWGQNITNTRFQPADRAGLQAADVPKLALKWAFGFPSDVQMMSHPTLAAGRVFVGSISGKVYSLDASSGCIHWFFDADATVRTAISVARVSGRARVGGRARVETSGAPRHLAMFGDARGNAYAVDALTGALVWKTSVEGFPVARLTGSPVFHRGRLYVPVSSSEEGIGSLPTYECCKFRGSISALDAATGKQIWKTYTIPEEPRPYRTNAVGTQLWGPSGAPVWSSPAIDEQRNALYATTGNNYSDPTSATSDAFIALDLDTGKILWSRQVTPKDGYVSACRLPDKTNCPEVKGPDFDFAASPILVSLPGGRRALIAGHKSGIVHAVDPDRSGAPLWQTRIGEGGTMGGVQWGSATDGTNVYVALSDVGRIMLTYTQFTDADPNRGGGMFALRLTDGARLWHTPPARCGERPRCSPAQSAAVSAIPGVAFSGSVDGHIRAYSTADGRILWDYDTARKYTAVNGVQAWGGSIDGPGPVIGDGLVFVTSGYTVGGGMSGNVLLAFSVGGK
jgi:polyvinyl alcohol dehydrogenase (cytochrome)